MRGWLLSVVGGCLVAGSALVGHCRLQQERAWEAVIMTEAAGESYEGQVAVAEVLRNRGWTPRGFAGIRRPDLAHFLAQQPPTVRARAQQALRMARAGSNLVGGATAFENVETFGLPRWAGTMEATAKIGRHTFFREKPIERHQEV